MAISAHTPSYTVRPVPLSRPFVWLARGWDDFLHHRSSSLIYGLLVTALGVLMFAYQRHPLFVAVAITAFLIAGPVISAGVCELSRCRDVNEPTDFNNSLKALRRNHDNLLSVVNYLFIISVLWFVASYIVMQSTLGTVMPRLEQTLWGDVLRQLSNSQMVAYALSWLGLSSIVFAVSVVTVPMIIDRHTDAKTAMKTSLKVTLKDFPAILLWGLLILLLVLLTFASYLIAMVVVFPLLGHASWYAYQDLVR